MGNPVVHFEVGAADDRLLVAFYGELFGWRLHGSPGGGYTAIDTRGDDGINGGIGRSRTGVPWSAFYVESDDLPAALGRAESLGGTTVMPVTDVGGAAAVAMFSDPDGLLVGLVQAPAGPSREDGPAGGAAPPDGPGEPVNWFEVLGSDAARTQQFYADLFGWTLDDPAGTGYATVDTGAGRGIYGGIGGGAGARWATVYAQVADVDAALGRAEKLGGSRIAAPEVAALKDAARAAIYGPGENPVRTETFRDPAGNVFGVFHYSEQ
jgi:hypothetical protein